MWKSILPYVASIVVIIVEAIAAKGRKDAKEKEKRRQEEMRLSMQMMSATLQLSVVTANALTGGHNNGNVERAKAAAEKAESEYQAFLQETSAHVIV